MKIFNLILATFLFASLTGCSTSINARRSYDASTDFSSMTSYAWIPVESKSFSTPESAERFQTAMDSLFAEKGFTLVSDAPNFLIKTNRVETYREQYKSISGGVVDFPKAMIRVDFLDATSMLPIYEVAVDAYFELDDKTPQEEKNSLVDRSVDTILSGFPPKEE